MTTSSSANSGLAAYAVADGDSRGRVHPRADVGDDSPFELDRYRILSCMAFRRLMHKTQVFVTRGDHFRTRLTHTLEVMAQAERLARLLKLNDRLAGGIALAHDLGHAPFGHAGEKALADSMKDHGGFEHNVQSLRVVDYLEHPFPAFRGLNLSFELRESLIKHETRYDRPRETAVDDDSVQALLDSGPQSALEGQVANLADAIAYTLHDIEDGLGQGVLTETVLQGSRLWREAAAPIRKTYPKQPIQALRRPIIDSIASRLAEDVGRTSRQGIESSKIKTVDDVRRHSSCLIAFSSETQAYLEELQLLLSKFVYRNHRVVRMDAKAGRFIRDLFTAYLDDPRLMPDRFTARIAEQGEHRVICDYIAGMTDRFCQDEHQRLFAPFHFE
ncbi:MAG: deoxyguanosinetriphosphate triphosphohydrolase [Phycisphaerales bacterium]|nr:deoxyguanosinetriphosphate triphosphohydrolase [Phycisphaerales bacterium]